MQPTPKPNSNQPIHEQVIEDIKLRAEAGKQNYGTYLQAGNGRDSLLDAYEEAQDLALYLKQAILERDSLIAELSAVVAEKDRLMRRVDELGCVAACAATPKQSLAAIKVKTLWEVAAKLEDQAFARSDGSFHDAAVFVEQEDEKIERG